jgi:hypothetical protein
MLLILHLPVFEMGNSNKVLNTVQKKTGHLNETIVFHVSVIVMVLVGDLVTMWREFGRPNFLECSWIQPDQHKKI